MTSAFMINTAQYAKNSAIQEKDQNLVLLDRARQIYRSTMISDENISVISGNIASFEQERAKKRKVWVLITKSNIKVNSKLNPSNSHKQKINRY